VVPRVVRVTFGQLHDLPPPAPGGHLRIAFVEEEPEGDEARYLRRTFTPRRFDPAAGELDVEFVLHGPGLATDWVRSAQPGDPVVVSGAGGRYRPEPVDRQFVIAVDDTGVPAAGTVVEALPPDTGLTVLCEVTDADDERPISPEREVAVTWLHRSTGGDLEAAVRALPTDLRAGWFVAAEARVVRRLDRHLRDERGAEAVEARGYWRRREGEV
jgi:NADPH-dependent ferric siderophore reductase